MKEVRVLVMKKDENNQGGMDLIEVSISLLILAVATISLIGLFRSANIYTGTAGHELSSLYTACQLMEQIAALPGDQWGQAAGGSERTIRLDPCLNTDEDYLGYLVVTTGGTASGQVRKISGFDKSRRLANIEPPWQVQPVPGETTYLLLPDRKYQGEYRVAVAAPNGSLLKTVTVSVYYPVQGQTKCVSLVTDQIRK